MSNAADQEYAGRSYWALSLMAASAAAWVGIVGSAFATMFAARLFQSGWPTISEWKAFVAVLAYAVIFGIPISIPVTCAIGLPLLWMTEKFQLQRRRHAVLLGAVGGILAYLVVNLILAALRSPYPIAVGAKSVQHSSEIRGMLLLGGFFIVAGVLAGLAARWVLFGARAKVRSQGTNG